MSGLARPVSAPPDAAACVTCGDVAVAATVTAVPAPGTAVVQRGGAHEEIATELVGAVAPGDVLLCHAGVALERLGGPGAGA